MRWIKKHLWLLSSILVASLAGRMLLTSHHFYVHDDIQVFRVNEFIDCIKSGQIPCRWSHNLGKGYGMPWFNFYPPLIYIVPSLITLTGLSIITSLNIFMFLTFIIAAWGMYCLVKEITDQTKLAFFGSVLFTLYPFHATNVFLRGVYAENLAWSLTPWVLYLIYKQSKTGKTSYLLPILFATIFLTHVISSFLLIIISIIWLTLINYKKIGLLVLQLILGFSFAAYFFGPAILEKSQVQSQTLTTGYYSYLNHFITLKQLFIEYVWNYGSSYWGTPSVEMGYMIGHIHLAILLSVVLVYIFSRPKSKLSVLTVGSLCSFLFLIFLTHNKSVFIWESIPGLAFVQFPWRFVGWAGIPLVLSITFLLSMFPQKISKIILCIAIPALLIYSYPFFFPREYDNYTDYDYLEGQFRIEQQSKALFDYLPNTVKVIPEKGQGIFYFPGWVSSSKLAIDPLTGIILDPPSDLNWIETDLRKTFDYLSIISISSYLLFLMYNKIYVKKP